MMSLPPKNVIKKVALSFTFLFLMGTFVFATGMVPGFTLDPVCNPGDSGCVVDPLWIKEPTDNFLTNIIDNVGIGTNTPSARLHVDGDGTLGSLVDALLLTVDGNEIMKVGRNDGVRFFDAYNFPALDGDTGQVLMTDGLGVISWEDISSYTFDSGLTESAGVVNLGGTLTQSTTIDTGNNNFYVGSNTLGLGGVTLEGYTTTLGGNYQLRLKTPNVYSGTATNGQVLRLLDASTGQVEFGTASSTNLYNTNGTLSGNRSITSDGNTLTYDGTGDISFADSGLLSSVGLTSTGALSQTGTSTFTGGMTLRSGNSFTFNNSANTFGTSFVAGNNTSNLSYTLPIVAPTAGQFLSSTAGGVLSWASSSGWGLTGNSGTNANTNFVGTTDAQDLVFKVNNIQAGRINKTSGGTGNQIIFGNYAGDNVTNATGTTFIGYSSGAGATNAQYSNFFGYNAGVSASSASYSNFLGPSSGLAATNAQYSNFLGQSAGAGATGANNSNFIGYNAGGNATGASQSNFIGWNAGSAATSAAYSTLIGYSAGKTFTGNNIGANNIIIGKNISLPDTTANAINIGGVLFGTGTYSFAAGNPSVAPVSGGKIGIGVVSPLDTLQVAGDIRTGTTGSNGCIKDFAGTGIVGTCSSDEELKTDIEDLPELSDKFSQVRFVTYKWNETAKEIYSNNTEVTNTGTIAQSVESQFPELVSRDDKGYRVVNYSGLLMYGMEAIKEVVSLADSFKEKLVNWFADAANNIELFIAGTIKARNELCVGETCINEAQLQQLLQNQMVSSSGGDSSSGGGTVTPDPDPIPEPISDPVVEQAPDPDPIPNPALDPEPIPEPVPEIVSE